MKSPSLMRTQIMRGGGDSVFFIPRICKVFFPSYPWYEGRIRRQHTKYVYIQFLHLYFNLFFQVKSH